MSKRLSVQDQVDYVSQMTSEGMREWLVAQLSGRGILPTSEENSRSFAIAALLPHLSNTVAEKLRISALEVLSTCLKRPSASQSLTEESLLLTQHLKCVEAVGLLQLAVAKDFNLLPLRIRSRIGQTFVALEANIPPSWWRCLLDGGTYELAGIVFDGLALVGPTFAIDFLSELPDDNNVAQIVAFAFPGFMDRLSAKERVEARALIASRIGEFKSAIAEQILIFFQDEETPIRPVEPLTKTSKVSIDISGYPALSAKWSEPELGQDPLMELSRAFAEHNPARTLLTLAHQ